LATDAPVKPLAVVGVADNDRGASGTRTLVEDGPAPAKTTAPAPSPSNFAMGAAETAYVPAATPRRR